MLVETIRTLCAGVVSLSEEHSISTLLEAAMRKANTDNSDVCFLYVTVIHGDCWKGFLFSSPFSENPSEPFGASVIIDGVTYGAGTASSKKLAKNKAGNVSSLLNCSVFLSVLKMTVFAIVSRNNFVHHLQNTHHVVLLKVLL